MFRIARFVITSAVAAMYAMALLSIALAFQEYPLGSFWHMDYAGAGALWFAALSMHAVVYLDPSLQSSRSI